MFQVCKEKHRFERLMDYFRSEEGNIDFMVRQAFSYIQMCLFCVRVHPSVQIKMSGSNAKGIFYYYLHKGKHTFIQGANAKSSGLYVSFKIKYPDTDYTYQVYKEY